MVMKAQSKQKRIRVAADIEARIIALVDLERRGMCSRAAIIRMALIDRYKEKAK